MVNEYSGNGIIKVKKIFIPVAYKIVVDKIDLLVLYDEVEGLVALMESGGQRLILIMEDNKEVEVTLSSTYATNYINRTFTGIIKVGESGAPLHKTS